ncbi:hypothetical protein HDU97_003395 [Phlyctochytrium planicorne]|nr:hypothetical protein HDU97_003395 [Phlyctochytrium planicorne]
MMGENIASVVEAASTPSMQPSRSASKKKKSPSTASATAASSAAVAPPSTVEQSAVQLQEDKRVLEDKLKLEAARNRISANVIEAMKQKMADLEKKLMHMSMSPSPTTSSQDQPPTLCDGNVKKDMTRDSSTSTLITSETVVHKTANSTPATHQQPFESTRQIASEQSQSLTSLSTLETTVTALRTKCEDLEQEKELLRQNLDMQNDRLCKTSELLRERETQLAQALAEIERMRTFLQFAESKVVEANTKEERVKELVEESEKKDELVQTQKRCLDGLESKMVSLVKKKSWSLLSDPDSTLFGRQHWVPDKERPACSERGCPIKFTLIQRRHHCRRCGEVFCSGHVQKVARLSIVDLRYKPDGMETKVCTSCFEATQGMNGEDMIE